MQLDANNFTPLNYIDKGFDIDVKGEEIFGVYNQALIDVNKDTDILKTNIEEKNEMKLGKVLGHEYNCGIALIDIGKMDMIGTNAQYNLSDYRVIIWQPNWLSMERAKYNQ